MGLFIFYVWNVMDILGMTDDGDSLFDIFKFIVTVCVIGLPAFIGKFQSAKKEDIMRLRRREKVEAEIKRFLEGHQALYRFDDIIGETGSQTSKV